MKLSASKLVDRFKAIIKSRKLGVLCGAGVSISSGIPDAFSITEILLKSLRCQKRDLDTFFSRNSIEQKGILPVAFELVIGTIGEKIKLTGTRTNFLKVFASNFKGKPNQNHFFWGNFLKDRKINFIATTNFDTCFEQSIGVRPLSARVIYPYGKRNLNSKKIDIRDKIIKLHGCMSDAQTIGTTIEQISRKESITNIDLLVERIFKRGKQDTILLLGYSCSDGMDIRPKIEEIARKYKEHDKVNIIYWMYKPGASNFKWEKLNRAKQTPDNKNAKEAFRFFKDSIQITGDLDLFVKTYSGMHTGWVKPNFKFDKVVANPLLTLGAVFQSAGFYDTAIKYIRKNLKNDSKTIDTYKDLGVAYNFNGEYDAALKYHLKGLSILLDKSPRAYNNIADYYTLIGENYRDKGDFDKAIKYYNKALDLYKHRINDADLTIAKLYNNLSDSYRSKELFDESIAYCEESLKIRLRLLGEVNHLVSNTYNNMGIAYSGKGKLGKALIYHKRALRIRMTIFGANHDWVAQSHINLGAVYYKRGMPEQANSHLTSAKNIYVSRVRPNHPMLAILYNNLGNASLLLKDYRQAISHYQEAKRIWTSAHGPRYHYLAFSYNGMGKAFTGLRETEKAKRAFNKGIRILKGTPHQTISLFDAMLQSLNDLK